MAVAQKITRATDRQIVKAFASISADIDVQAAKLRLNLYADGNPASFNVELSKLGQNETIERLLDQESVIFREISIQYPPLNGFSIRVERAEPFDLLHVNVPKAELPADTQAAAMAAIDKHLMPFKPTPIPESVLGSELANFYRSRDEVIAKLERLNTEIIGKNDEHRRKLEVDFNERKRVLEQSLAEDRETLEQEIAEQREALQHQKKELDDRSARHARRQQYKDLKTVLQNRNSDFALTEGTVRKRRVLHALFTVLVGTLGVIVTLLAYRQLWLDEPDQYYGLRLPVAVIGFVLALVYYIRWNNEWFERHADEEFRLKRYDLDMDRAGWLVELAIEAYESGEEPIPEDLLRRLASNMFIVKEDDESSRKRSQHPSTDMRDALLDAAGEVEVNIPGIGKVVLTRKQMRRLQRDIEKGRIEVSERANATG